jgi:hypothetical protein
VSVLTPIATPQANAVAERLVGTFRRECLDHIIVINERHLRHVLREFVRHYNSARPHRALDLDMPEPGKSPPVELYGPIVSRPVLGELTHEYERRAASARRVTAGADTHRDQHVVAVLDERGSELGVRPFPTTTADRPNSSRSRRRSQR